MYEFLENLEVGSRVIRVGGGIHGTEEIRTVARLTKTLIILDNDARHRRNSGQMVGVGGYHTPYLVEYTKEGDAAILKRKLIYNISVKADKKHLENLDAERLMDIWNLLTKE